jgi:predicted amidohydrolase YtcJ
LKKAGDLTCRILAVMPIESRTKTLKDLGVRVGFGDPVLRIGALKCFSDGSMGAGSALFYEPYTDEPTTSGLGIYSKDKLTELILGGHEAGLQVMTHAIGDKANCWVLDAYEAAIQAHGNKGLRHRIEHAQVVNRKDLPRFAELDVIASIQPSHCIDDMRWAEKRIGRERCAIAYMYKSFYDVGARVAFGTDWPVEPLNPMLGLYAAVTREFPEGGPEDGWFPDQIISMETAIKSYTLDAAYAEHQEEEKGSIEVGKLADLVVLDRDLFTIPQREILQIRAVMTVTGGTVVFER